MSSSAAVGHNHGCHGAHTCPSDHHTYVWFNGATGWDCAHDGEKEVGPADTTRIDWDGRTYYCHAAGSTPPTTTAATTTAATTTGATTTAATTAAVTPPTCQFLMNPSVQSALPRVVTFYPSARATSPATLDHITLAYGDGKSDTLPTAPTVVNHTYASGGTYNVQLNCVDSRGGSSVATATVQVPATPASVAVTTTASPAPTPTVVVPPAASKPKAKPKPKCKPGQRSTTKRPCRK